MLICHFLGFGYHGDFMMGWDSEFLQQAVDQCTNLSGQIQDCALFTIQDESVYGNCNVTLPSALAKENVVGAVTTMPGNPVINYGPGYASGAAAGGNSATATVGGSTGTTQSAMTLSYSAGSSIASSSSFEAGGIFVASSGATFTPDSTTTSIATSSSVMSVSVAATTAPAVYAVPSSAAPSYFSTAYNTLSPNEVEEVLWVEEVVTVTEAVAQTASVTVTARSLRKRHAHGHKARF